VSPLWRKLRREIERRRGQFVAIVLMSLLGTALFGASFDAYRNLQASYDQVFVELGMADFTISGVPASQAGSLAAVDGVATVDQRDVAESALRIGGAGGRTIAARLVAYPTNPAPSLDQIRIESGNLPTGDDQVVLEKHLADTLALSPGATLEVALASGWHQVTVSGTAVSPEYLWPARSRQDILVPPDQWGVVFAPPALVDAAPAPTISHQLLVGYAPGADRTAVDTRLETWATQAGATDAYTRAEQASNAALHEDINGFGEMSLMFPLLFLGAAGIAVYVLLGRLVRSQRAEIGTLLALGLTRGQVIRHYLAFGAIAVLVGAIPGAFLGVALGSVVTGLYTGELGIPTSVVNFYPETPLIGLVFALVVGLLAALVPALRASRMTPAEAMRGTSVSTGGESLAERVVPPLRRLPSRWKLVVRGIGRSRARSFATVVGIVLAVTLVLTSWGLLDTIQVLIDRQFGQIERQAFEVVTFAPVSPAELAAAQAIDGVAGAEPVARIPAGLASGENNYGTTLVGFEQGTAMHTFLAPDGSTEQLPADGLLVGDALRNRLSLTSGETVTLTTADGGAASVRIAGFVHEPLGTYAYASLDYLRATLGSTPVDDATRSIFVSVTDGASPDAVESSLKNIDGVATVVSSDTLKQLLDQFMGLFYAFVGVMFVLGALLALALIYATISANVSERTVELANLRASGMSAGEIGRMITAENLLLTAIGVVPGLIVGYLVAAQFMASFSSDLFEFDLQVRPLSFLAAALACFVAVGLSLWPALRAVNRVDLGRVVRERAT
jgi:putative ABC transport system permease protein